MQHDRPVTFEVLADPAGVAAAAAAAIRVASAEALSKRGRFRILLAGGSTPLAAYRLLAQKDVRWQRWEVYFGDERCLSPEDPGRNSRAAGEAFLDAVAIPPTQIFPIPAELGAEAAAASYRAVIEPVLPFDLVLLGMGEDGHTASLFPGLEVDNAQLVIPVHGAPKPPRDRVSLTFSGLSACRRMLILVTGPGKREALRAWRRGDPLPVARAASEAGARVLLDAAAAGKAWRGPAGT
jgi:6-phosphogluconolactonase